MDHPFVALQGEYATYLAAMKVTRPHDVDVACLKIREPQNMDCYRAASAATGVPAVLIGALDYRESDCNPHDGFGQGDPWNAISRHVPRGQGPFKSRLDAMIFYIKYDHLDVVTAPWSPVYCAWKGEAWNGFGYRAHGEPTPYDWGATSIEEVGKFASDGHFDRTMWDTQVGIMPIIMRLIEMDHTLAFGPQPAQPAAVTAAISPSAPLPVPEALAGGATGVEQLQEELNALHVVPDPLAVDGNIGRRTRTALRAFQVRAGLPSTGLADAETISMLRSLA